ncbi:MAG TPA: phage tail sheath subtilisin-like domain-containing protein [Longimicrobiales bacterium]|nr:phage tail sheath subtilisin-like domain-containing protein [Longimicrobiales bacterium]
MPEYLAPGVYVEETSFRAKTIEGVSTSTAGFVGAARYGPTGGTPQLVTSFAEFERIYGGLDQLEFESESEPTHNYLAQGVRAFFDNGGRRLYIARVYVAPSGGDGRAGATVSTTAAPSDVITLTARYPGQAGDLRLTFRFHVSQNVLADKPDPADPGSRINVLSGVGDAELLWVPDVSSVPLGDDATGTYYTSELYFDDTLGRRTWRLRPEASADPVLPVADLDAAFDQVRVVTVGLEAAFLDGDGQTIRQESWDRLSFDPDNRQSLSQVFAEQLASRSLELSVPLVLTAGDLGAIAIARVLLDSVAPGLADTPLAADGRTLEVRLRNGSDGSRPDGTAYGGHDAVGDGTDKTGLVALEDIPDVSIIAAPGYSVAAVEGPAAETRALDIAGRLISHCERMRYCIAVLDPRPGQDVAGVRGFRAQLDSTYAALYYPFVRVLDPVMHAEVDLPASGHVAGIYARNDVQHGVHKAPANEVVRGAIAFERTINKAQQDVLNPENINVLRTFEGRGNRVWGARTVTSDPEWKYVNVRRYFLYLERSIDVGTQWVVFENNGDALWANVRRTVEDFLFNEWKSGHLLGAKPEQAYFVRCDRTTMTQNDLDNGRLICLVGVSPLRPAEFVIFRIGQWTADRAS